MLMMRARVQGHRWVDHPAAAVMEARVPGQWVDRPAAMVMEAREQGRCWIDHPAAAVMEARVQGRHWVDRPSDAKFHDMFIHIILEPRVSIATDPQRRKNAMGPYRMASEIQCQKLCWYHRMCSSYSFNFRNQDPTLPQSSGGLNCVLHTDSDPAKTSTSTPTPAPTDQWRERAASSATIHNPCKDRPCDDASVCVPHYPHSSPSSPTFHCVPLPAQCGPPYQVSHGHVNVSGTLQGHTGHVSCHSRHVPSPRHVPLNITCQETSKWTSFMGSCLQYDFYKEETQVPFTHALPWPLQHSLICVEGFYIADGQLAVNLKPSRQDDIDLHFILRLNHISGDTGVFWNRRFNKTWEKRRRMGDLPLSIGDPVRLFFRVWPSHLQVTLNSHHVYNISTDQQTQNGVDLSQGYRFLSGLYYSD
ncbi:hypothetical protein ACOMHN_057088 [Nucella lapillus]